MSAPPKMTAIQSGVEDGITWAVCRAPLYGAANGYAQIPEDHPWHGLDYDEIDVDVHGGLTFARDGWIGFDTLHVGDYWRGQNHHFHNDWCVHWTDDMVVDAARELARKVAGAVAS